MDVFWGLLTLCGLPAMCVYLVRLIGITERNDGNLHGKNGNISTGDANWLG